MAVYKWLPTVLMFTTEWISRTIHGELTFRVGIQIDNMIQQIYKAMKLKKIVAVVLVSLFTVPNYSETQEDTTLEVQFNHEIQDECCMIVGLSVIRWMLILNWSKHKHYNDNISEELHHPGPDTSFIFQDFHQNIFHKLCMKNCLLLRKFQAIHRYGGGEYLQYSSHTTKLTLSTEPERKFSWYPLMHGI